MSESLTGWRQHGRGVVFTWSQSVRMFLGNDATEAPHMKNVASWPLYFLDPADDGETKMRELKVTPTVNLGGLQEKTVNIIERKKFPISSLKQ